MKIFVLVDALGWDILRSQKRPFLEGILYQYHPIQSVLGYSSGCYPTIFSGVHPEENGLWGAYHRTNQSRFKWLRFFGRSLDWLTQSAWVQNKLSKVVAKLWRIRGYFQLYRIPVSRLPYFDVAESKPLWEPGGIPGAPSLFDHFRKHQVPFEVFATGSDQDRLEALKTFLKSKPSAQAVFVILGELDLGMHIHGPHSPQVGQKLALYEKHILEAWNLAQKHHLNNDLTIFSDHGMAPITQHHNVREVIDRLSLRYGRDFISFYDSTMVRLWYHSTQARDMIRAALKDRFGDLLHCLSEGEKTQLGINFSDHRYGEDIFLVHEGHEIVPSYMSKSGNAGMHGYHPSSPSSVAVFATTSRAVGRLPKSLYDLSACFSNIVGMTTFEAASSKKAS